MATWPTPTSQRELQQFLGLASYYRCFIQDFATLVHPLHKLTEKNHPFNWTPDCQNAFSTLRHRLVSAPILVFPDFTKTFILDTDANGYGLGAMLSQVRDEEKEAVVAYASRVLTKSERRYCVTRRELLAVMFALQQFRPYLLGILFILRFDHGSLTWLCNFREPEGQLVHWLEKLEEYSFTVHRKNIAMLMHCLNCHADNAVEMGWTVMGLWLS